MSDKPAMNTLKKTFTAMLSRIGGGRVLGGAGAGDTSGSDNISVNSRCVECLSRYRSSFLCVVLTAVSRYSNALESRGLADRPFTLMRRGGAGLLSRASSVASVGGRSSGRVGM